MAPSLLYLSGAPRISTSEHTESLGPRNHVLGVIGGFRSHGWDVDQYVAGDRLNSRYGGQGSEDLLQSSRLTLLAADVLRLWFALVSSVRVRRIASKARYDLVYERYGLFQALGAALPKRRPIWVLEVNAMLAVEATTTRRATFSRRFARFKERRAFAGADVILAVTDELKDSIVATYGIDADRIVVIPNGVDSDRFRDATLQDSDKRVDRRVLGFVGALYPWQRVDSLVRAVGELPDSHVAWIAGTGPAEGDLRSLVDELELNERVKFFGRLTREEVPEFLSNVDIAYSGHSGGDHGVAYFSPLKLWEYLAAGKPVVCSAHAMSTGLVAQGYPVVIPESDSLEDLVAAIQYIAGELNMFQTMASEAQEKIRVEHSWSARVGELLSDISVRQGRRAEF